MKIEFLNLILNILIIFLFIYWILFKNYLQEKGKNLATKEDIEEITKKVESVKNEINSKNQQKLEFIKEQKETLLNFFDEANIHIYSALRIHETISKDYSDPELINEALKVIKSQFAIVSSKFYRIYVYFDDKMTNDESHEFYSKLIDLHNRTLNFLIRLNEKAKLFQHYAKYFEKGKSDYGVELDKTRIEIQEELKLYDTDRVNLEIQLMDSRTRFLALISIKIGLENKPSR